MISRTRNLTATLLLLALLGPALPNVPAADPKPLEFRVTFTEAVSTVPFNGRVYVMLSKNAGKDIIPGPNWFKPEPFFARDVKTWQPDTPLTFRSDVLGHPCTLPKLPPGQYWVQAIMDFDRGDRPFSSAAGNGYSKAVQLTLDPDKSGTIPLLIDQVYAGRTFKETERVKLAEIDSKVMAKFTGRAVRMRAGVVLPKSFAGNPDRRYPVVYEIPGFGGNHFGALLRTSATDVAGVEMIHVVLDPNCRWGHHVFADSANCGPLGTALCEEFIPFIEKKFRGLGVPAARFVTGHSSGGWSSLWLQVSHPDFFGGTWSTAPDPVDFRDFTGINIYKPGTSVFTDEKGERRPIAQKDGKPSIWFQAFSDMEEVMGHGGQLESFEAVFSPRGEGGKPKRLWDRKTGLVNPDVARSWEKYDIRLVLERNWPSLGPKLAGKLHVYMGGADTFYLTGATVLLKESLKKLGSDAVIEIFPGRHHGNLIDSKLRQRIDEEMATAFRKHQPAE
jgi:S-formylglutathione hydrolase FrmB